MTITDDGGPAFPVEMPREIASAEYKDGVITATVRGHPGMTLRDWLVGQALTGRAVPGLSESDEWEPMDKVVSVATVQSAEILVDTYLRRRAERNKEANADAAASGSLQSLVDDAKGDKP